MDLERFKRFAYVLRVFFNFLFWVSILAATILLVGLIGLYFTDTVTLTGDTGSLSISYGPLGYEIAPELLIGVDAKPVLIAIALSALVVAILAIPIFYQLTKILKTVEEEHPFALENANRLNIIGMILILAAFAKEATSYYVLAVTVGLIDIPNLTVNYSLVDTSTVITGFLVLLLASIFKYGSYLQEEHDSTV